MKKEIGVCGANRTFTARNTTKKNKSEIMAAPEFPGNYAYFGDGTFIVIKKVIETSNSQGVLMWTVTFRTHLKYERKWEALFKEDPGLKKDVTTGMYTKSYPKDYFYLLDPNPETETFQILCTFDGKKSPLMDLIEKGLMEKLVGARKQIERLMLRTAALEYENKRLIESSMTGASLYMRQAKKFKELQSEEQKQVGFQ